MSVATSAADKLLVKKSKTHYHFHQRWEKNEAAPLKEAYSLDFSLHIITDCQVKVKTWVETKIQRMSLID